MKIMTFNLPYMLSLVEVSIHNLKDFYATANLILNEQLFPKITVM